MFTVCAMVVPLLLNELLELEDVPFASWIDMYFQHEGAPSHYARLVA
jgi:hypothetical protein